jgi:hypothetical protein
MSWKIARLIPALTVALLTACGTDLLAPRKLDNASLAARAVTETAPWSVGTSPTRNEVYWVDDSRNESGWEVHRSTTGAAGTYTLRASLPANTAFYADTGLTTNTEYCYKMRSFKLQGKTKSYAASTSVTCAYTLGPPTAASNVAAVPRNSSEVDVSWVIRAGWPYVQRLEIADGAAGPWQAFSNLAPEATTFRDYTVSPETQRCYRIITSNEYGPTASIAACTTTMAPPGNIAATVSGTSVVVTWTDNSAFEDGYEVQRSGDDMQFVPIATPAANATSYTDATVTPSTRYWYRVRARKAGSFSSASDIASAVVMTTPPPAPAFMNALANGSTVQISFEEPLGATSFRVDRSTDDGSNWTTAGTISNSPFVEEGRPLEERACYRVSAVNGLGPSAPSATDCVTPLAAPTNVLISWDADGTATISWVDNSSVEMWYEVLYFACFDGWWCDYWTAVLDVNSTSISFGPEASFEYVIAANDGGYSDPGYIDWSGGGAGGGGSSANLSTRTGVPKEARMSRATTSRPAPCVASSGRLSQSQLRACSLPLTPVKSPNRR